MSLTRSDIQILKEVFQPEFARIDKRFEQIDKKFEQIDKRFEQMEKRFDEIDRRFDKNDKDHELIITQLIAELHNVYTPRDEFDQLEKRVTTVENKLDHTST